MGVVHKLKEDVISFIVNQKTQDSQLSCRGLVNIINDHFQVQVSKSSINSILRNSHLSSPVGRRPLSGQKPRKFSIPENKKSQLFIDQDEIEPRSKSKKNPTDKAASIKTETFTEKNPLKNTLEKPETRSLYNVDSPKAAPLPQAPEDAHRISTAKKFHTVEKSPGDSKAKIEEPQVLSFKKPMGKGILYDGMGCFILKAAQWDLSFTSVLGKLLSKHIKTRTMANINAFSDVLLYCEAFNIPKIEDILHYYQQGLWVLNGLNEKADFEILKTMANSVEDLQGFSLQMSNEKMLLLTEINHIKLWLEDHTELWLDAQFNSIWDSNVQSGIFCPLDKILNLLSAKIINNAQPVLIRSIPDQNGFADGFFEFFNAFEDKEGKRVVKIGIFDRNNEEIAQFSILPRKKRFFSVGAWPWQREFSRFIAEDSQKIEPVYLEDLDREIYCSELKNRLVLEYHGEKLPSLRGVLVRETPDESPLVAVLSNLSEEQASSLEIAAQYLRRWPNLQKGQLEFVSQIESSSRNQDNEGARDGMSTDPNDLLSASSTTGELWPHIRQLLFEMHRYCQRQFLPPSYGNLDFSTVKERIYSLPGYLRKAQDSLVVHLVVPESYPFLKDVEFAVSRLNESDICNSLHGKCGRLFFIMESAGP